MATLPLRLAGAWLLLCDAGHTYGHVTLFVTRQGLSDSRQAAYELMKEPMDGGLNQASFWTVVQMLSLELTFFLAFAALLSFWIANKEPEIQRGFAGISATTFSLAALSFGFLHPQIHALVIAGGAALLFLMAWVLATPARAPR